MVNLGCLLVVADDFLVLQPPLLTAFSWVQGRFSSKLHEAESVPLSCPGLFGSAAGLLCNGLINGGQLLLPTQLLADLSDSFPPFSLLPTAFPPLTSDLAEQH